MSINYIGFLGTDVSASIRSGKIGCGLIALAVMGGIFGFALAAGKFADPAIDRWGGPLLVVAGLALVGAIWFFIKMRTSNPPTLGLVLDLKNGIVKNGRFVIDTQPTDQRIAGGEVRAIVAMREMSDAKPEQLVGNDGELRLTLERNDGWKGYLPTVVQVRIAGRNHPTYIGSILLDQQIWDPIWSEDPDQLLKTLRALGEQIKQLDGFSLTVRLRINAPASNAGTNTFLYGIAGAVVSAVTDHTRAKAAQQLIDGSQRLSQDSMSAICSDFGWQLETF